jgi:hypothetical protein
MGIKQLFNKAAKGVKTFFKKDGTLEGLFNKGTAINVKVQAYLIKVLQCLIKVLMVL